MRVGMVFAVSFLLSLTCDPHLAAAQSSPVTSQPPRASLQNSPPTGNVLALPEAMPTAPLPQHIDTANDPTTLQALKTWTNLQPQHQKDVPGLKWFGRGLDATQCAHIRIFQAPNIDSEMIVQVPPGSGGDITIFQGLLPCCRDLMTAVVPPNLHQAKPTPPGTPLLQAPALDLETFKKLRP